MTEVSFSDSALVLLSGGLDSATCLAIAKKHHKSVWALSFAYGQRHSAELEAARRVARSMDVQKHLILNIDLSFVKGSALTGDVEVPLDRDPVTIKQEGIPSTYVPARNTIFLSYALAVCEEYQIGNIYIGVNNLDYSGYPDCRPRYIEAFQKVADLGTKAGVEGRRISIKTPLIDLKKYQIIRTGIELGVDYSLTVSCYKADQDGRACGRCDSCILRKDAFRRLGVPDPTRYRET